VLRLDARNLRPSQVQGFTLVELIGVLLLLSILAAVAIPRYLDVEANASTRAIEAAVAELNGREGLLWANVKLSVSGYDPATGDSIIWENMKNDGSGTYPDIGEGFTWDIGPIESGGTLRFRGGDRIILNRTPSTTSSPARWMRQL